MNSLSDRLQEALGETYAIEHELGGGGMSRVFAATEVELGRKVVVKVLPPDMAAGVNADRFRREIQMAASLQHPHVVPLLRAGRAGDLVWYTMPMVEGESLRAKLAREGELPIPDVVRVLRDIVSALAYAHSHGVVHRDIKPDNILLTDRYAVVTDFGVAKAVSEATGQSSLTSMGVALGTPAYMAPEQAAADPHTDHRADIYAAGIVGYEMLAGSTPFVAPSPQMVLAAQVTQQPTHVTQHRASVPPALAAIIMRCLEKKAADRFQSATELFHQLDAMATPSGGMAPTASLPAANEARPPRPPVKRWVWGLAAGAAIAIASLAGFVLVRGRGVAATTAASTRPMLVVLPFENLGSADDQYFADGITEEITSRLASLGGLGVISRTSAMQYRDTKKSLRQIGQELNVAYVLEGTIRWEKRPDGSSRVRVSPQLIKVADDTHLWANTYDGDLTEVFRVQSDIAGRVADALNIALTTSGRTERPPTDNTEAYAHYLRGNEYWNRGYVERDVRAAIESYERAVALDPKFAHAYARLSTSHSRMFWFYYDRTDDRLNQARSSFERALQLEPGLGEGHLAQGYFHYWGRRDYGRALTAFEVARRAEPNNTEAMNATAYVMRRQGKWREAVQLLEQSAALDPRSSESAQEVALTYDNLRDFDQAERWSERALAVDPDNAIRAARAARIRAIRTGQVESAHTYIAAAMTRMGSSRFIEDVIAWGGFGNAVLLGGPEYHRAVAAAANVERAAPGAFHVAKGEAFVALADPVRAHAHFDSARIALERMVRERSGDAGHRARLSYVYAHLGRMADALREGRRAVELLPIERDAVDGSIYLKILAGIHVKAGELDAAIPLLERLLSIPSELNVAMLRMDPTWRPLYSHPRFQRLLTGP